MTGLNDLTDVTYDTSSQHDLIIGQKVALATGAAQNIFIGELAGATAANSNSNTTGNTAVGYTSMQSLTSGSENTALGTLSLNSVTSANYNTAVGYAALQNNTGSDNTGIGLNALFTNTTGVRNVAIGSNAVNSLSTGSHNVGIGFLSGGTLTTGSDNVFIGYEADVTNSALSNAIAIGKGALVSGSNTAQIGNSSVTAVYFGAAGTTLGTDLALAGNPTTTTQSVGDNSTRLATTAYADRAAASITPLIRSYLAGAAIANNATTPNTKVDIAAGSAADSTNAVMITSAGYTVDFSVNGAVNRLDTGTIAASTWYHLFLIAKADGTTGGLGSTSATSPTLPSGYSYFRRVGSVMTGSTSHILSFTQVNEAFYWGTAVLDLNQVAGTTTATLQTLSVPTGVKVQPIIRALGGATSGTFVILLTSPDETDVAPGGSGAAPGYDLGNTNAAGTPMIGPYLTTNTSGQIRTRCGSTNSRITIVTRGWIDTCGRFA